MLTKERCKLSFEDVKNYGENNIPPHIFFEELIKASNRCIDVLDSIINLLHVSCRNAMKRTRKNMKMLLREMSYKKTRLPRKLKKKYKKLGIYDKWKEENL